MAPALTEPLSPTEKLTSSAVTATATPTTRSSRKLENSNNTSSTPPPSNTTKKLLKEITTQRSIREKRNRASFAATNLSEAVAAASAAEAATATTNSSSVTVQTPTSSKRITRSKDITTRRNSNNISPLSTKSNNLESTTDTKRSASPIAAGRQQNSLITKNNSQRCTLTKNEQMGLSTALPNTKIPNINNNNTNLVDNSNIRQQQEDEEHTSTAQLLADLTNEALTAEICLRNQLKDVNLVKTSGDSSSPLTTTTNNRDEDNDILLLKSVSSSELTNNPQSDIKSTVAHMEAQSNELTKLSSQVQDTKQETDEQTQQENQHDRETYKLAKSKIAEDDETSEQQTTSENASSSSCQSSKTTTAPSHTTAVNMETIHAAHASPVASPVVSPAIADFDHETKKISSASTSASTYASTSKPQFISVEELPPVSTDSTMTASEVEDNLEERLSQLDGTAIDSPPPASNSDVCAESRNSATIASSVDNDSSTKAMIMALDASAAASPQQQHHHHHHHHHHTQTPPRTPPTQQDIQQLQEQLQHTPPTPVSQQVQQQQLNCFTPQSTTSSVNTLGSGNIPQSFIKEPAEGTASAELEDQDIEEVFKVLKGFETGGATSDLNVCDLNVLFNEVYMKMNESEPTAHHAGATSSIATSAVATSIGSVQHINVSAAASNPSIQPVNHSELDDDRAEIEKRQQQMQRKIEFLMRRMRKIQARYMCKHTSEEIAGLFEWSAKQANKDIGGGNSKATATILTSSLPGDSNGAAAAAAAAAEESNKYFLKIIAARPPASEWSEEQKSQIPATHLSSLLRKIEAVANAQQQCFTTAATFQPQFFNNNRKSKKALALEAQAAAAAAANSSSLQDSKAEEVVISTLAENTADELTQVAGLLQTEMSEVQKAIDSDATESSSGGESADEMVTYNNQQQQTLPITKRAAWRYSRDRAAIASRWSWLLSQISDLEIKIRQHSELHQEIVRTKGPVVCGPVPENGLKNNIELQQQQQHLQPDKDEQAGSCRTRGYNPAQFRKRKLLQTTNIHTISKKAARPSSLKCGCQWPLHPCALCTGRSDPTAPRDLPDTMMKSDRIALLDPGYHPVLSFRENVNNALHFEAIAKLTDWQHRVMRCQAKNIAKSVWKAEREAAAAAGGHSSKKYQYGDGPTTKRRYIKKKDRINNVATDNNNKGVGGGSGGTAATSSLLDDSGGNGTANLSTSTTTTSATTPLVANKLLANTSSKYARKQQQHQHCPLAGDGILKEPAIPPPPPSASTTIINNSNTSLVAAAISFNNNNSSNNNTSYLHQTSDCRLQTNYEPYNPNQIPSSLTSHHNNNNNNNNSKTSSKYRKLSSSATTNSNHHHQTPNNNNPYYIYNGSDSSYDTWAGEPYTTMTRSRASSPTHASSGNNYHKYDRYLDRKNRTSYDIDNIVIPYSVAAATRVELLPYKEIPTPKWRVIEIEQSEKAIATDTTTAVSADAAATAAKESVELNSSCKSIITNGHNCDNIKLNNNNNNKIPNNLKRVQEEQRTLENNENIDSNAAAVAAATMKALEASLNGEEKIKIAKDNSQEEVLMMNNHESAMLPDVIDESVANGEPELKKLKIDQRVTSLAGAADLNVAAVKNSIMVNTNDSADASELLEVDFEEDITDEALFFKHERALTEERRKFQTYLKFPWSTRSRANRRIDSRAESSGANTPDPSSPAPQTPSVGGGDQESIPSPIAPSTPMNPMDTISEAGDNSTSFLGINSLPNLSSKRNERRRTTSTKRDREVERRSSTPDAKELIPPYEPLKFPLSDEQVDELMRAMPSDYMCDDIKRFDDCFLPGGGAGSVATGAGNAAKYNRNNFGLTAGKRISRTSTVCSSGASTEVYSTSAAVGGQRRSKTNKHMRPISADDCFEQQEEGEENDSIELMYEDDEDDDYKHHLAPNDDDNQHLTADSVGGCMLQDDDYDDAFTDEYGNYKNDFSHRRRRRRPVDSEEGESSEEDPFADDDPNDPEWQRGTEDRLRKKT